MSPKKEKKLLHPDKPHDDGSGVSKSFISGQDFVSEFPCMCMEEHASTVPEVVITRQPKNRFGNLASSSPLAANKSQQECQLFPKVTAVYDTVDKQDVVKQIFFHGLNADCNFVRAVNRCLVVYQTVSCVHFHDCNLHGPALEEIAIAVSINRNIEELSLDMNPVPEQNFHVILSRENSLHYLSLRQCRIQDEALGPLADELSFKDPPQQCNLKTLILTSNRITSEGAKHLARALRTNRKLVSLSLAANHVCDDGAVALAEVLQQFPLTFDEVVQRRGRNFRRMKDQFVLAPRPSLQGGGVGAAAGGGGGGASGGGVAVGVGLSDMKTTVRKRTGRKRSALGKDIGPIVSENIQPDFISGSHRSGKNLRKPTTTLPESKDIAEDPHPYMAEVTPDSLALWCRGNFTLSHLNLAYNNVQTRGISAFLSAAVYQEPLVGVDNKGLLRITLHGNPVPPTCFEIRDLTQITNARFSRFLGSGGFKRLSVMRDIGGNIVSDEQQV